PASTAPGASPAAANTNTPGVKKTKVLVDSNINDEQLKQILAKGYRPEYQGDKVLYCRKETPVGTRFATKTCRTSIRILEDEQQGKAVAAAAQRDNGNLRGK